jgi:hypothetical protein
MLAYPLLDPLIHGAIFHALIRCSLATPLIRQSVDQLMSCSVDLLDPIIRLSQVWQYQGIDFIVPHLGIRFHCNVYTTQSSYKVQIIKAHTNTKLK